MKARSAWVVFAIIAGIIVAGCGSKDDSGDSAPPSPDKAKAMTGPAGAAPKAAGSSSLPAAPQ